MIAIIGAGISGLTLAYRLQQQGTPYILLDSSSIPGGYMQSEVPKGRVLEKGPNSILADEFVLEFINTLGLSDQVVRANDISKKRYIYKKGGYRALPSNPLNLLFGSFFSFHERIKIIGEFFRKGSYDPNASLYDLILRHFGQEAADYALDPFVSGVYAGDPKELLADLCFPVIGKNIQQYGSILKGFIKNPPQRKTSITFKKGLHEIIAKLSEQVLHKRYACKVKDLSYHDKQWSLLLETSEGNENLSCTKVVMALPAYQAAPIIRSYSETWAKRFNAVEYPMVRNMHLVFKKNQVGISTQGFGALHPSIEPLFTAGVIWNSAVFDGRTPNDEILLTCMVTEKRTPIVRNMTEAEVEQNILQEIKHLYQIKGDPIYKSSGVWEKAIPQYNQEMRTILKHGEELEKTNVYICSNWPYGISITDCIHRAHELAEQLKE